MSPNKLCTVLQLVCGLILIVQNQKISALSLPPQQRFHMELPDSKVLKRWRKSQQFVPLSIQQQPQQIQTMAVSDSGDLFVQFDNLSVGFQIELQQFKQLGLFQISSEVQMR